MSNKELFGHVITVTSTNFKDTLWVARKSDGTYGLVRGKQHSLIFYCGVSDKQLQNIHEELVKSEGGLKLKSVP